MSSNNCPVVKIGLLGYGTVGSGTYRMLADNIDEISRKSGCQIEVKKIGILDADKKRDLPCEMFTTDLASIVDDPEIQVILELIGGENPACELVERALANGKHIVTANKELIAKHGSRLTAIAHSKSLDLHFEAAVGGGIPIVQPMKHQLAGNDVLRIMGILNGTTNHILTEMRTKGAAFADALKAAQDAGYAEADPTNDVDGFDTMYKIAILAGIAFGGQVPLENIHREGIRGVSAADFKYADALGYTIKLLGICDELAPGKILIRVHPTLIKKSHQLASVEGVYNALWLHGDFVGDLMFSGRGAGASPTASAVVGDLIDVARSLRANGTHSAIPYGETIEALSMSNLTSRYYIRLRVVDKPNTLGRISTMFGLHEVGLAAMEMRVLGEGLGEIAFLTHLCNEQDFTSALDKVRAESVVDEVSSWMRVED